MRNLNVHSVEAKHYAERTCSSSFSENPKCWLRHVPPEFFTEGGNPQIHRDAITACLRCEVFPPSALLVVRSVEYGKALNRESAVPISNLAPEARIAPWGVADGR